MSALLFIAEAPDQPEARLLAALAARGNPVHVILHPKASRAEWLQQQGVLVHPHPFPRLFDRVGPRLLRTILRSQNIQLVHSLRGKAAFRLSTHTPTSVKRIAQYDDTTPLAQNTGRRNWIAPGLDQIVCSCHTVRILLTSEGIPANRITTIYKGVDPAWYGPPSDLQEFNLPPKTFTIGYSGPILPSKGIASLAESLQRLPPEPRCAILLAGPILDERPSDFAMRNRTRHLLLPLGPRHDDTAIMAACDIFAMPSISHEGAPRPLIEAMFAKRPAIITPTGGLPELIEHKRSGWVVRAGSSQSIARAILAFAKDPEFRKSCGEEAAKRAKTKCSFASMLEKVLAVYHSLGIQA